MVVIACPFCQRIQALGLVLWIDQNTFATGLLEKIFKTKRLSLYTLTDVSDFRYLVQDLKPILIVLDNSTALTALDAFKIQYESIKELPFVLIDPTSELDFIENVLGIIQRPFDPFKIPETLENLIKGH